MKRMIITTALLMAIVLVFNGLQVFADNNPKEVKIKTSMHCESCKNKIEKELTGMQGIESVKADLDTKIVTVKFEPSKTDQEKIMESLRKMGYTATIDNDVKTADPAVKTDCKTKCASKTKGCCNKN